MKRLNLLLGALLATALINPLWAQGMHQQNMGMGNGMGMGMHNMMGQGMMTMPGAMGSSTCPMLGGSHMQSFFLDQAEALNLTDSQIAKLEEIRSASQKSFIKKQADLRIAALDLDEALNDAKAKSSDLEARAQKVETLRSALRLNQFKSILSARSVLTEEQLKKATVSTRHSMNMMNMGNRTEESAPCGHDGNMMMGNDINSPGKSGVHEKHHLSNG